MDFLELAKNLYFTMDQSRDLCPDIVYEILTHALVEAMRRCRFVFQKIQ